MIIKEHGLGWIIEPVTSDQRQALEKIIEGLRDLLCVTTEGGSSPASHSHPSAHAQSRGGKEQ